MASINMSYHDNEVGFDFYIPPPPPTPPMSAIIPAGDDLLDREVIDVLSGQFAVTDFSISDGQDPDGKNKAGNVHGFTTPDKLRFVVGRHKSGKVADFWNKHIASNQSTFNHGAGELNFAFLGTLRLNLRHPRLGDLRVVFEDIALAQGSSGSTNNWWFGGKHCLYTSGNTVRAQGTDQDGGVVHVKFSRGGSDNVSTVWVDDIKRE